MLNRFIFTRQTLQILPVPSLDSNGYILMQWEHRMEQYARMHHLEMKSYRPADECPRHYEFLYRLKPDMSFTTVYKASGPDEAYIFMLGWAAALGAARMEFVEEESREILDKLNTGLDLVIRQSKPQGESDARESTTSD